MPLPQLISITPNPIPSVPCWVTVCYDFESTGATSPAVVEISFGGTDDSYKTEVTKDNPCVPVYVPADASSVDVVDASGQSQDKSAQVLPD